MAGTGPAHRWFNGRLGYAHDSVPRSVNRYTVLVVKPIQLKSTGTGLRDQLMADVLMGIDSGTIAAGQKLPSVRTLARLHGVSPHTAAEAYQRLVAIGRIEARPGSGYFPRVPSAEARTSDAPAPADALWERRIEAPDRKSTRLNSSH